MYVLPFISESLHLMSDVCLYLKVLYISIFFAIMIGG